MRDDTSYNIGTSLMVQGKITYTPQEHRNSTLLEFSDILVFFLSTLIELMAYYSVIHWCYLFSIPRYIFK